MHVIPSEEYYGGKRGKLNRVRKCGRQEAKIIWRRQLIQIKMKSSVFVWSLCLYVFIYITLKKQLNKYDTNHKIMQTYINKNLTAVCLRVR